MRRVLSGDEDLSLESARRVLLLLLNLPHGVLRQEGLLLLGPQLEVGVHPRRTEGPLHQPAKYTVSASRAAHNGMPRV